MKSYTVNVVGDAKQVMAEAKAAGYRCYSSDNVTAIEVKAKNKRHARRIVSGILSAGRIAYIYE